MIQEVTFVKKVRNMTYPYLAVSIPIDVIRALKLKEGDYVEFHIRVIRRK